MTDVSKYYRMGDNTLDALSRITFAVESGSFCAVMGPSGSGKSTLLNLLGCLDRPDGGSYRFAGKDVSNLTDDALSTLRLEKIGFIFQNFNLITQLTVRENIELPLYYSDWSAEKSLSRSEALSELVGLADKRNSRPTELSGGQQQRVAIARALANDPELILADEPTGNLDTDTGRKIMALLSDLHLQGKTIIMVTHDSEVASYAERRIFIRDGSIISDEAK